jgi:hypothetical protein
MDTSRLDDRTRLTIDIAGGASSVTIWRSSSQLLGDCQLHIATLGSKGNGPQYKGVNVMVPLGMSDEEVHWIFKDKLGARHNPYSYKMQRDDSHQFCQSHALKLAYDFCSGRLQKR